MSCPDTNPCDPCQEVNGCYDNCGCINPTTFECITEPGTLTAINVTNDMNGKEVLQAINDAIENIEVGEPVLGNDVNVKISSQDTTTGYLGSKIVVNNTISKTILTPGGNETLRLAVNMPQLLSTNSGNLLELGTDGKLRVLFPTVNPEIFIEKGSGVTVTGTGAALDPFVISINPSITATRSCFDGVWRNVTLVATGTGDVVHQTGTPQYRVRFDGTIEFRGSSTYVVNFGTYASTGRKKTVTVANINNVSALSGTCGVTSTEMIGISDLKSMTYIDQPGTGDQITQMYGYIIRRNGKNIILEFQSSFISATEKTIVVNYEGVVIHPSI